MPGNKKGLEVWLGSGRKVNIGGREFLMLPLPLKHLKKALQVFDERTQNLVRDFVVSCDKSEMNHIKFAMEVLNSFDTTEIIYTVLSIAQDPDTDELINKGVSKEWLEDHLDLPTVQKLIVDFMEINQIEEVVKKAKDLPTLAGLIDALTMTYGMSLLKSSQLSTDLPLVKSEISQSPKSTDTSKPATSGIPESASGKITVDSQGVSLP